jgi:PhnB protein
MSLSPYVFFQGTCKEALNFYAGIIGQSAPDLMPVAGSDMAGDVAEDKQDWILHGMLALKDGMLMASDDVFGSEAKMSGAALMLNYATADEAKIVHDQLSAGGTPEMPFAATFWSAGFGSFTDRFGIKWMVGCDETP